MKVLVPGLASDRAAASRDMISTDGTDIRISWPTIWRRLAAARPTAILAISALASRSMSEKCMTDSSAALGRFPEAQIGAGQERRERFLGQRLGDEGRIQLAHARHDL